MRGSIAHQVNRVFDTIKAFGTSKHADKEQVRQYLSQNTWHNLGKELKVYSYAAADQYRAIWKEVFLYARINYQIKDIEKLSSDHVKAYLKDKITNGVKFATFQKYAAAIEKLEVGLNKYAQSNNTGNTYKFAIADVRKEAQQNLEHMHTARAYENPQVLISAIKNDVYKTLAMAQYLGGFRVNELNYLSSKNFLNNNTILVTNSKGGLQREIELPEKIYNDLLALIQKSENGKFIFSASSYRNALKQAAINSNQQYTGSHGLRWSFAQEKFFEIQKIGYGYEQTLSKVSELLGHHRADITQHYLRV